jgi:hypothetical protein
MVELTDSYNIYNLNKYIKWDPDNPTVKQQIINCGIIHRSPNENRISCSEEIVSTQDSKYIYSSDNRGFLKLWSIPEIKLVRSYGKVTDGFIYKMEISADNKLLFILEKTWEFQAPKNHQSQDLYK